MINDRIDKLLQIDKRKLIATVISVMVIFLIAKLITTSNYLLLFWIIVLITYAILPPKYIMGLLVLACFFPISFGQLGPIKEFLWVEWMAPVAVAICFLMNLRSRQPFLPDRLFVSAILVLLIWAGVNYAINPVSSQEMLGAGTQGGGLRGYYLICMGTCVFFAAAWFSQQDQADQIWISFLKVLLIACLVLGVLRIFSFFLEFDLPLIYGTFRYAEDSPFYFRIGGLSDTAGPGMMALIALQYKKPWSAKHFVLFLAFLGLAFLSGGRAFAIGLLCALAGFFLIMERMKLGWVLGAGFIAAIILFGLGEHEEIIGQISRLGGLKGGLRYQDLTRLELYEVMWELFMAHPIWGKGIGMTYNIGSMDEFINLQLTGGGHGAYLSMFLLFGIGGMFFLIIMLFGAIGRGVRYLKAGMNYSQQLEQCVVFVTFYLIIRAVEYIPGGNGYGDMTLYLLTGTLAGLFSAKPRRGHA
jgi:hypothetical protein